MALLFKYRSATVESVEMLRRRVFWAAVPQSFNDPFDCTCAIIDDNDRHKLRVMLVFVKAQIDIIRRELGARQRSRFGFSRTTMRDLIRQFERADGNADALEALYYRFDRMLPEAWRAVLPADARRLVEQRLDTVGVVSLSSRCDSLLMWAHYSDSHHGYCLGFDHEQFPKSLLCQPVIYSRRFPDVKLEDVTFKRGIHLGRGVRRHHRMADAATTTVPLWDPVLLHVIYSKAEHWAYEQESRILVERGGNELGYPGPLREVIFGMRCSAEMKALIVDAVCHGPGGRDVQFFQAVGAPGEFGLAFVREEPAAEL
jgi:hypothetical protein